VNPSSIARRYARALFELAVEDGQFEAIGRELATIREALESDPDMLAALHSPSTTREERAAVAEALIRALKSGPTLANSLRLLADRRRLTELPAIERVYRDLADDKAGRVRAQVVSAVPLTEDAAGKLVAALSKATRRNVVVERSVNASILGGAVAKVGSQVFDGSIKSQLAQLKEQLKA
jgi:F-type H+-transporting ATPase subunit delta